MTRERDSRAMRTAVTAQQMAEIDRRAVTCFELSLLQMMENAGRALARVARERCFEGSVAGARIGVLAGPGGNGGGALVAARRLAGWGAHVDAVVVSGSSGTKPETLRQRHTAAAFGVHVIEVVADPSLALPTPSRPYDLLVDGLLGYGAVGAPRGAVARVLAWAVAMDVSVLALDLPSGMDATSGTVSPLVAPADATVTLAALKTGLLTADARAYTGALYLADIGVPAAAFVGMLESHDIATWFIADDVVRVA